MTSRRFLFLIRQAPDLLAGSLLFNGQRVRGLRSSMPVLDGSLCSGQPGDRHPVGGAGHVVQADPVAELHRGGVSTVLAADAQMEAGTSGAAQLDGHLHQLAHALLVQMREGIGFVDLLVVVIV